MNIIVTTCDTHRHLVRTFAFMWNKYASAKLPVTVAYATLPPEDLPGNFTPVSLGEQTGNWSGWFKRYLKTLTDDVILLTLEDFWLVKPVDIKRLKAAHTYMQKNKVDRMELSFIRCDAGVGVHPHVPHKDDGYLFCPDTAMWLASTQPSFWRREFLIDVLKDGESVWDFENYGSERLKGSGMVTLATEPPLIWHDIGVHGGKVYGPYDLQHMKKSDQQALKDAGLLPEGAAIE